MVTNDLVPEGIIERFPPGPGEGVGGQNVGRAEKEDDPDAERRRRARLKDADPAPSFGAVAQAIPIAPGVQRAQGAYQEALKQRAATVAPQIEATQQTLAQPRPPVEAAPTLPAPPSLGLTPFLAPVEGERPENTIAKLIQGVGLLAVGVAGRKDARASLAALTGALKGWQEGDKERADRHFADWQAQSETLLRNWKTRRETWRDIMDDRAMSQQDRIKMFELSLLKEGFPVDVAKAQLEGAEYLQSLADAQQAHVDAVELKIIALNQSKAKSDELLDIQRKKLALLEKASETSPFSDEDMTTAAKLFVTRGIQPSFGMGASARPDRARFWHAVTKEGQAQGGPGGIAATQAAYAGLRNELGQLMKTRGLVEAFSNTALANLKDAVKVSDAVDRTGSPMLNRWLLNGRKAWSGDPLVADFDVAARSSINEIARVLNSANASGVLSDTARKEIDELLNTALNKEQFVAAARRFEKEMANRRTSYETQIEATQQALRDLDKPQKESGATPKGETKTLNVPGVGEVKVTVTP